MNSTPLKAGDRVAFRPGTWHYGKGLRTGVVVSITETLGDVIDAVMPLMPILDDAFKGLAEVLVDSVVPALEGVALTLEGIARSVAFITGRDLEAERKKKKSEDNLSPLAPRTSGFEQVQAAYERIAKASVMVGSGGKSEAQQQLEISRQGLEVGRGIADYLRRLHPTMV